MILIAEKGCATLVPAARSAVGDKSAPIRFRPPAQRPAASGQGW